MIKNKINEMLTIFGFSKRGIFIPHRYVTSFKKREYFFVNNIFSKYVTKIKKNIELIKNYEEKLCKLETSFTPGPRWNQDWFPLLDAASTYLMVRKYKPKKIIEIGSGHSTRFLVKAIEDEGNDCELFCIDPEPRANINNLPYVTHFVSKVQDLNLSDNLFENTNILFIDSSHILMPGSDVDMIFNHILPKLKEGTLLHIHDIFLPYSYPNSWGWRNYNEQTIVASIILSENWDIEWSSHYIRTNLINEVNNTFLSSLPLVNGAIESSLWLKKK